MADVYTSDDLVAVTNAIRSLMTGSRAVTVTYAGPPQRSVTYAAVNLGELRALQAEIQREVNGSPTFRRISFAKGFDDGTSGSSD
jgi:hypothetical protein